MATYFTELFSRVVNQMLLLLGGVLMLAVVLSGVSAGINEAGEKLLGRNYRYLVAPGIVCHEAGHVLGCALTGTRIYQYDPFDLDSFRFAVCCRHHRHHCFACHHGHGFYRECHCHETWPDNMIGGLSEFVIGIGPILLGCLVIWLISRLMTRSCLVPDFNDLFPLEPVPDSGIYWKRLLLAAGRMFGSVVKVWKWRSPLNLLYLYLVFAIASEMFISWCDLQNMWLGLVAVFCVLAVLNAVPAAGFRISVWTYLFVRRFMPIHMLMLFVLVVDALVLVLLIIPARIFHTGFL